MAIRKKPQTKYEKRNADISNYRWKKWIIQESERRLKERNKKARKKK